MKREEIILGNSKIFFYELKSTCYILTEKEGFAFKSDDNDLIQEGIEIRKKIFITFAKRINNKGLNQEELDLMQMFRDLLAKIQGTYSDQVLYLCKAFVEGKVSNILECYDVWNTVEDALLIEIILSLKKNTTYN